MDLALPPSDRRRLGINDVPNEILAGIFQWVSTSSSPPCSDLGAAEILNQVCSLWRELAHVTPALWTELNLNVRGASDGEELLTQWFSRSHAVVIVLRVDPFRPRRPLKNKNVNVMETVCAHSDLWRRFHLSAPWSGLMNFFTMGALQTPNLEELVVEYDPDILSAAAIYSQYLTVNAGRTTFGNCTQLKSIRLGLLPTFPLELLSDLFPWKNLTEVVFQKPGVHPALVKHVFAHCKGLTRLKIWTNYWRNLEFSMEYSDEYCLEYLESFDLEADIQPLVHILRSVQLPALKSLSLSRIMNLDEARYPVDLTPGEALMRLKEHSDFSLSHLEICGWMGDGGLRADDVLRFLAGNPGILSKPRSQMQVLGRL
ncbi:hypothetical protein BT96DRAFT_930007 [Gymnopus androsaceus JB14]|uniref:F-box domain-containing protein n=1 Tax=Gymnopus androsaceus JB14 TaxID=1447944 RepID=A0A6A4GC79_9AGAR|nr:hypothetical protein BT96DRAFT_930007 [Gymnopus androsaceus JB14]